MILSISGDLDFHQHEIAVGLAVACEIRKPFCVGRTNTDIVRSDHGTILVAISGNDKGAVFVGGVPSGLACESIRPG